MKGMKFSEKTFLLGIGAQKAGTSWLHGYLSSRRDIFMSPLKEMHVFDVKYRPDIMSDIDLKSIQSLAQELKDADVEKVRQSRTLQALIDRVRTIYDPFAYVGHFARNAGPETRLYGEITPSYALLPEAGFAEIARLFPRRKIVYLLRDPVERFLSHLRMETSRGWVEGTPAELFERALDQPAYVERTLYHETYARLLRVFSPEEVFIGFYETLFCDEEIGRLCRFLGIPFIAGRYEVRVNESPPEAGIDARLLSRAREQFAPVYDFCRREFGPRVPAAWRR